MSLLAEEMSLRDNSRFLRRLHSLLGRYQAAAGLPLRSSIRFIFFLRLLIEFPSRLTGLLTAELSMRVFVFFACVSTLSIPPFLPLVLALPRPYLRHHYLLQ